MSASVDSLIARLTDVERRLAEHASRPLPESLSDPDPGSEERWEAGQVWAHLAEFPEYWLNQARRVIALPTTEPVPFGRVKTDVGRVEAIERERHTDPQALMDRVRSQIAEIVDEVRSWTPEQWQRRGIHPVRGEMTVETIVKVFIVDHLEEHADQLDAMASGG
ncbi:MAG TPA: DinB family protein [Candidatus Limnocylindria bacterium]|nr:DinB family protein [Candidatus Limnocylindria bacterium]